MCRYFTLRVPVTVKRHWRFCAPIVALALGMASCAKPPAPLAGTFQDIGLAQGRTEEAVGLRVRWGGTLVSAAPGETNTCFEIVNRPLDAQARPRRTDETDGRFLACMPGFADPIVYAAGREVTVVGTLREPVVRKIGDYAYTYPQVTAEHVYLWPPYEPAAPLYYNYPWWPDVFWWGLSYEPWYVYPPTWGPWRYGLWPGGPWRPFPYWPPPPPPPQQSAPLPTPPAQPPGAHVPG